MPICSRSVCRTMSSVSTNPKIRELFDQLLDARLELHRSHHAHLEAEVTQGAAVKHLEIGKLLRREPKLTLSVSSPGLHLRECAPWTKIELPARRRISPVRSRAPSAISPATQRPRQQATSARRQARRRTYTARPRMQRAKLRMPLSATPKTLMRTAAILSVTARKRLRRKGRTTRSVRFCSRGGWVLRWRC